MYFDLGQKFQMVLWRDSLAFRVIPSVRCRQNSSVAKVANTSLTFEIS